MISAHHGRVSGIAISLLTATDGILGTHLRRVENQAATWGSRQGVPSQQARLKAQSIIALLCRALSVPYALFNALKRGGAVLSVSRKAPEKGSPP
jgi:hypothetical protein